MKDEILKLLKESNKHLSGEYLCGLLGVSRAAIWKAVKQLEKEGYIFDSKNKIGYKLVNVPDRVYPREVKQYLTTNIIGNNIYYFDEIDSTNSYAKNLCKEYVEEGSIVVSETQSKGRGRFGRIWLSPQYKGLYFSLVLTPNISLDNIGHITILIALAVCKALEERTKENFEIKWPNDILYKGKKVCGILTEISGEIDAIPYVVVGIGLNVNSDGSDFDDDLKDIITSLKIIVDEPIHRIKLFAEILNMIDDYYTSYRVGTDFNTILLEYKKRLSIINKNINIKIGTSFHRGTAINIMPNGALKVKFPNGEIKDFISGEVTIRK